MLRTFKNETEKHKFLAEIFFGKMKKDELLNLIVEHNIEIKYFKKDVVELLKGIQQTESTNKNTRFKIINFMLRNNLEDEE